MKSRRVVGSYVWFASAKIRFHVSWTSATTNWTNCASSSLAGGAPPPAPGPAGAAGRSIGRPRAPAAPGESAREKEDDQHEDQAEPAPAGLAHRDPSEAAAATAPAIVLDLSRACSSPPLHRPLPARVRRTVLLAAAGAASDDSLQKARRPDEQDKRLHWRHGSGTRPATWIRAPARAAAPQDRLDRRGRARRAGGDPRQAVDQEGVEAPGLRARGPDDGPDDARGRGHAGQGRRALLEGRAAGPGGQLDPVRRRRLRLPEPRPDRRRPPSGHERPRRLSRDRLPVRPVAARRSSSPRCARSWSGARTRSTW